MDNQPQLDPLPHALPLELAGRLTNLLHHALSVPWLATRTFFVAALCLTGARQVRIQCGLQGDEQLSARLLVVVARLLVDGPVSPDFVETLSALGTAGEVSAEYCPGDPEGPGARPILEWLAQEVEAGRCAGAILAEFEADQQKVRSVLVGSPRWLYRALCIGAANYLNAWEGRKGVRAELLRDALSQVDAAVESLSFVVDPSEPLNHV